MTEPPNTLLRRYLEEETSRYVIAEVKKSVNSLSIDLAIWFGSPISPHKIKKVHYTRFSGLELVESMVNPNRQVLIAIRKGVTECLESALDDVSTVHALNKSFLSRFKYLFFKRI